MPSSKLKSRRGLTLVELVLVLVILTALAALVVPLLDLQIGPEGNGKSPERIATEESMRVIRDTIMGTPDQTGVWADVGQRPAMFPRDVAHLYSEYNASLSALYPGLVEFDATTAIGWRGPYLIGEPISLDGWGLPLAIQVNFDGSVDSSGLPSVDSTEARHARIVSAGENGIFDTPFDTNNMIPGDGVGANPELTLAECGDDIVLFFRVADERQ